MVFNVVAGARFRIEEKGGFVRPQVCMEAQQIILDSIDMSRIAFDHQDRHRGGRAFNANSCAVVPVHGILEGSTKMVPAPRTEIPLPPLSLDKLRLTVERLVDPTGLVATNPFCPLLAITLRSTTMVIVAPEMASTTRPIALPFKQAQADRLKEDRAAEPK
jgi:hypothetical protein